MVNKMDVVQRELQKYLKQQNPNSKQEIADALVHFQKIWNSNIQNGGNGNFLAKEDLDEACDLLERAKESESIVEARKLAKQAYKKSPECFDAVIFLAQNAPNISEAVKIITQGLQDEEKRLKSTKIWTKQNLGYFYGILETRPYIRGLFTKARLLIDCGKFSQSATVFERIIELNHSDNLGARLQLMAIYAYLEDLVKAKKLLGHYYDSVDFSMALSLFLLYYKLDMSKEADKYLRLALDENKHVVDYFNNDIEMLTATLRHYDVYQVGSVGEVAVYVQDFGFLVRPMQLGVNRYIYDYLKRQRQQKPKTSTAKKKSLTKK